MGIEDVIERVYKIEAKHRVRAFVSPDARVQGRTAGARTGGRRAWWARAAKRTIIEVAIQKKPSPPGATRTAPLDRGVGGRQA